MVTKLSVTIKLSLIISEKPSLTLFNGFDVPDRISPGINSNVHSLRR